MATEQRRQGRVLVVDNTPEALQIQSEYLHSLGYRVFTASSYEEAVQMLRETWVHLALLDVRLTDETDDKDLGGLLLAQDEEFRATPMLIITKYPTWQAVRGALSPTEQGPPPAVGFIDKQEGLEAMAQAVAHAFKEYVRINNDLIFQHDDRCLLSWSVLAQVADPDLTEAQFVADRAEEMEDLWRRLFYELEEVHLARLLLRRGRCAVLHVFAFPSAGHAQELIVTVGPREIVAQESQRHAQLPPLEPGQRGLRQAFLSETHNYAAVAYAPIGGDLEEAELLADYYRAVSADEVCLVVDDLFGVSALPWHQQPRVQTDRSLNELYRERLGLGHGKEDRLLLEESVEGLCGQALSAGWPQVEATRYRLTFHLPDDEPLELPHPAVFVFPEGEQTEVGPPTLCGVNVGAVQGNRILVDSRSQQTWLLDFSQIGLSPVLDDYASLEAAILFDLVAARDLTSQRQLLETLLQTSSLDDPLEPSTDLPPDLCKAVRVISLLRQRASRVSGSDLKEYQLGVLFQGACRLLAFRTAQRYPRHRLAAGLNVLISAALIGQWLEGASVQMPPSLPEEAKTGLWVDEAGRSVWVEGRQVALSRMLFDLFMLLYHRAGQVCDRATIAREVFKVEFFDPLMEETRINPLIGRLRKRVEPDPSRPRYIITHHGVGYVLHPRGQSENK